MKTIIFLLLLTLPGYGQTNYPPNSTPYNISPTNWVYDCSFHGYGNLNPDATNLPCGWYDEPTNNVQPFSGGVTFGAYDLWLEYLSNSVIHNISFNSHTHQIVTNADTMAVYLMAHGTVQDSNYEVYATSPLASTNWNFIGNFGGTYPQTFFFFQWTNTAVGFFRIKGAKLAPETFGGVTLSDPVHFHASVCFTGGLFLSIATMRILART